MRTPARFAAALVLSLASFAVCADDLQFVNDPGPYTAPVGSDFTAPNAILSVSGYPSSSSVFTAQAEIIGGCGTFAGATEVSVSLTYFAARFMGPLPPLHISQPGFCTLRLTLGSLSRDAKLEAWDPATLHVEAVHPIVAVPTSQDVPGDAAVRVVDAGGRHAKGETVRFGPSDCIRQGLSRTSGADGIAYALTVSAPSQPGHCLYPAVLSRNGSATAIDVLAFDATKARLTLPDSLQSYVGERFLVPVGVEDENGQALPRVHVDLFAAGLSDGANATAFAHAPSTDATGDDGVASIAAYANAQPGYYDIAVVALGRELRVPVTQQRRGAGTPPLPVRPGRSLQDLWWGGPSQNGWGMSIVQHGQVLFCAIYMYEGGGIVNAIPPDWIVMPGGRWNATGTTYYGPIYQPSGSPYSDYAAARFNAGPAVGSLAITYIDESTVEIQERQGNEVRVRRLTRQLFGSGNAGAAVGDMWWGGPSQNGWGIAVIQQGGALFSIWFTYDGSRTWFVMPSGAWTSADTWEGRLYRTSGSDGWGYDGYVASYFKAIDVGSFKLKFSGDSATFTYDMGTHSGVLPLQRQSF